MVFIKIKTTRDRDLEILDQARRESGNPRKAAERLDKVFKQSKDWVLEGARKKLIEAHKRRNLKLVNQLEEMIKKYTGGR